MRAAAVPEAELAVLLAGTAERRAAMQPRIAELAAGLDERRLVRQLGRAGMTPLAVRRLGEHAPGSLSAALEERLRTAERQLEARGHVFLAASSVVLGQLEGAGVPALGLKGPWLAVRLYDSPALRAYDDLDVMVSPGQLAQAAESCWSLGYEDAEPVAGLPLLHRALRHATGALPPLELHWRIHWYERAFAADMLARAEGAAERVAAPLDELASLLLFAARDGFANLRLAADVAAWWDRFGGVLEPGALGEHCRRYPALAPAWRAACLACERGVGLPGRWLLGARAGGARRRERVAARLANWELAGDPDQVSADIKLVDVLCSPRGERGAVARRQLLPGPDSLRAYYGLPEGARVRLWLWQVLHPPKMLARFGLALAQARLSDRRRAAARP